MPSIRRSLRARAVRLRDASRAASLSSLSVRGRASMQGRPLVAGFLSAPTGLGEGARLILQALRQSGFDPACFDLTATLQPDRAVLPVPICERDDEAGPVILHANPPEVLAALSLLGKQRLKNRRMIGMWLWERERLPAGWLSAARWFDEIWAASGYNADVFASALSLPVRTVGYPIGMWASGLGTNERSWEEELGLADRFAVLVTVDPRSSYARKNPLAAITAFQRAFPDQTDVALIVKLTAKTVSDWSGAGMAAADRRIALVTEYLSGPDNDALIAAADCVLSLHRAEGYGLLPAKALALGKPVVATAYSGVMAYADCPGFHGVPFEPASVADPQAIYAGTEGSWAEPDGAAAATMLKERYAEWRANGENHQGADWWRKNHSAAAFVERSGLERP